MFCCVLFLLLLWCDSVFFLAILSFSMTFFFVKHKTAYEMRICDWSSDVCSSDLGPVDWWGGLLAVVGLGAVAYALTAASDLGWTHPVVLGFLVAGAAILAMFLRPQARAPAPMMPLGLFRSPAFSGANAMTLLLYFALSGAFFLLPFNLIRIQGYSATAAGAAFLPFTLVMGGLSRWSGGLVDRYGARRSEEHTSELQA